MCMQKQIVYDIRHTTQVHTSWSAKCKSRAARTMQQQQQNIMYYIMSIITCECSHVHMHCCIIIICKCYLSGEQPITCTTASDTAFGCGRRTMIATIAAHMCSILPSQSPAECVLTEAVTGADTGADTDWQLSLVL